MEIDDDNVVSGEKMETDDSVLYNCDYDPAKIIKNEHELEKMKKRDEKLNLMSSTFSNIKNILSDDDNDDDDDDDVLNITVDQSIIDKSIEDVKNQMWICKKHFPDERVDAKRRENLDNCKAKITNYVNKFSNLLSTIMIILSNGSHQTFNNCEKLVVPNNSISHSYFNKQFIKNFSTHIASWYVSLDEKSMEEWFLHLKDRLLDDQPVNTHVNSILKNKIIVLVDFSYFIFQSGGIHYTVLTGMAAIKFKIINRRCKILDFIQTNIEIQHNFGAYGNFQRFIRGNHKIFISQKFKLHLQSTYYSWWKYFVANSDNIFFVDFLDSGTSIKMSNDCVNFFYDKIEHKICPCCNLLSHLKMFLENGNLTIVSMPVMYKLPKKIFKLTINIVKCGPHFLFDNRECANNDAYRVIRTRTKNWNLFKMINMYKPCPKLTVKVKECSGED